MRGTMSDRCWFALAMMLLGLTMFVCGWLLMERP